MTARGLVEYLRGRGVQLVPAGNRLRYRPLRAVTPEIRALLVRHKSELLKLLEIERTAQRRVPIAVSREPDKPDTPVQIDYRGIYQELTADIATPDDIDALRWVTDHHGPATLRDLLALDGECTRLAAVNAPVHTYQAAVERLSERVRQVRTTYREARRQR